MPNHCTNRLFISVDSKHQKELDDFRKTSIVKDEEGYEKLTFNGVMPMPKVFDGLHSGSYTTKKGKKISKWRIDSLGRSRPISDKTLEKWKKKYGATGWYSWSCNNWGTKWDAYAQSVNWNEEDTLEIEFDTAWSPPIPWLEAVAAKYPHLDITMRYEEEGMGFMGKAVSHDGAIHDQYIQ